MSAFLCTEAANCVEFWVDSDKMFGCSDLWEEQSSNRYRSRMFLLDFCYYVVLCFPVTIVYWFLEMWVLGASVCLTKKIECHIRKANGNASCLQFIGLFLVDNLENLGRDICVCFSSSNITFMSFKTRWEGFFVIIPENFIFLITCVWGISLFFL